MDVADDAQASGSQVLGYCYAEDEGKPLFKSMLVQCEKYPDWDEL